MENQTGKLIYMERTLVALIQSGVPQTEVNKIVIGSELKTSESGENYFLIKEVK